MCIISYDGRIGVLYFLKYFKPYFLKKKKYIYSINLVNLKKKINFLHNTHDVEV